MAAERSGLRAYKVEAIAGDGDGWRVRFFVDGEDVGGGVYPSADDADDAGIDFMFDAGERGFYG